MSRVDTSAREACEAAAAWRAPRIHGTTVEECLTLGEGAAIVQHLVAGVLVVHRPDVHDPDVVVIATHQELFGLVKVAGQREVAVARQLTAREALAVAA